MQIYQNNFVYANKFLIFLKKRHTKMLKDGYGYVYLLKEDGDNVMYKIGVTKSPKIEDRIKKLQTGNGNRIVLIDCFLTNKPFKLEKMLHTKYSTSREEGEWFLMEKVDVESFAENCKKFQAIIDSLEENPFF